MSDPPTTLPSPHLPDPHHHQALHLLPLIHGGATPSSTTTTTTAATSSSSLIREYRKGNWTVEETLILITAKRLDDERRVKSTSTPTDPTKPTSSCRTSGELRWKWVENYCWTHGCLRSQNQCNDKWDNLLRDYKKVRDYDSKSEAAPKDFPSYWTIDKHQRKERNLPSNMVFEVYQAINQVLHRKHTQGIPLLISPSHTTPVSLPPPPLPPPPPPPPRPPPPPPAPTMSPQPISGIALMY